MNAQRKWNSKTLMLRKAQAQGRFSEFHRRPGTLESAVGYLLEDSLDCLLIEALNWDSFQWNGKCIIWKHTVKEIHCFEETEWPIVAARQLRMTRNVDFEKTRDTLEVFLQRHLRAGEIILLEQEKVKPDQLFLCEMIGTSKEALHVKSYDHTLLKAEELIISFRYVTKITFGDAYSRAAGIGLEGFSGKRQSLRAGVNR